jgi:hypothetical protein
MQGAADTRRMAPVAMTHVRKRHVDAADRVPLLTVFE